MYVLMQKFRNWIKGISVWNQTICSFQLTPVMLKESYISMLIILQRVITISD